MVSKDAILKIINLKLDPAEFRDQHWRGSFHDYLSMVSENPRRFGRRLMPAVSRKNKDVRPR